MNSIIITSVLLLIPAGSSAQTPSKKAGAAKPPAGALQSKYKAIWERVAFNKDLGLNGIWCTAAEVCWAAGDKSTILLLDGGRRRHLDWDGELTAMEESLRQRRRQDDRGRPRERRADRVLV